MVRLYGGSSTGLLGVSLCLLVRRLRKRIMLEQFQEYQARAQDYKVGSFLRIYASAK